MMSVRKEQVKDYSTIDHLVYQAFKDHPMVKGEPYEPQLIRRLREEQALSLALVAELDGQVVGHIAFSALTIDGQASDYVGLAPVSVLPEWQHQGIGSSLIKQGLEYFRTAGAGGCALLGEPEYYQRFGFKAEQALKLEGVPPEYFMVLHFKDRRASGAVGYHRVFSEFS